MGGCQNYGPLLGPLNTRCRVILRTQRGTRIWQPPIYSCTILRTLGGLQALLAGNEGCLPLTLTTNSPDPSWQTFYRGPKDHMNIWILHSGCKTQDKGDARNHGLENTATIWCAASPSPCPSTLSSSCCYCFPLPPSSSSLSSLPFTFFFIFLLYITVLPIAPVLLSVSFLFWRGVGREVEVFVRRDSFQKAPLCKSERMFTNSTPDKSVHGKIRSVCS